jgi:hypothetical protein
VDLAGYKLKSTKRTKAEGNRDFTDDEFSEYVLDSENAMSREHTMWLAQKRM